MMISVHIPPTLWSHVNVYGKYEFDVDAEAGAVDCDQSARHQRLRPSTGLRP